MKRLIMKHVLALSLLVLSHNALAGAVTIDFENTLPTYFGLETYQQDGFTLTSNVPDGTLIDDNNTVRANLGLFGGGTNSQTIVWGANGAYSLLSLASDNGDVFGVLGLDASSMYNVSGDLLLTGTLAAGGTVSQTVSLNSNLTSYLISGMTGLSALDISFDGTALSAPFDLDNIQLEVIPVPAAVWLFVSALGFLGFSRRRAK